ncbi:MAG: glycogen phosphorylase, partial [Paracoccus sp. (in: a-proteobacteria)]
MSDPISAQHLRDQILYHLTHTQGRGPEFATTFDWRLAVSFTVRDLMVGPWVGALRAARAEGAKRVYYLSMEFLIGRILGDAIINLGLDAQMTEALAMLNLDRQTILDDEP